MMSEKRFKYVLGDGFSDGFIHLSATEVCELLNEQQFTIQSLKEENEQLRKELDSFNPVMFQDMRKGTVTLYSKGGIDE